MYIDQDQVFKNLNYLDPKLNAVVVAKLKEIQKRKGMAEISMEDLTSEDKYEIMQGYALTLYKEHRLLREQFLEGMNQGGPGERLEHRKN